MVTISSYFLPENIVALSQEHLISVCSSLIDLQRVCGQTFLFSGKPFLSLSLECENMLYTIMFKPDVTAGELIVSLPSHIIYSQINLNENGN